jgi:hypothetical protein
MCKLKSTRPNCNTVDSPGLSRIIRFIPVNELTGTMPPTLDIVTPATTIPGASKILAAPFTYVATTGSGYWREIEVMLNSADLGQDLVGEGASQGFENKIQFTYPDDDAAICEFLEQMVKCSKCGGVLASATNPDSGLTRIIGTIAQPAMIKAGSATSGDKVGGKARETKVTIGALGVTAFTLPTTIPLKLTPNP